MKKGFGSYIMNDGTLFMATAFVISTPLWILLWILSMLHDFSLMITFFVVLSYICLINSYVRFNPEEYKKKKTIKRWIDSLSIEEQEELKTLKSTQAKS